MVHAMPNAGPGGCQDGLSNRRYHADLTSVPARPTAAVAATAAEVTSSDDAFLMTRRYRGSRQAHARSASDDHSPLEDDLQDSLENGAVQDAKRFAARGEPYPTA